MLALVLIGTLVLATRIPHAAAASSWGRARYTLDEQKDRLTWRRGSAQHLRDVTADAAADRVGYLPGFFQQSAFDMYAG